MNTPALRIPQNKPKQALRLVKTIDLPREDWLAVRKHGIGSSDAAALLLWLQDQAGDKALTAEDLNGVAVRIGADVPFFLLGSPARAQGIGEVLVPVEIDLSGWTLVVVCPDQHVSSAWAYQEWDGVSQACQDAGKFTGHLSTGDLQKREMSISNGCHETRSVRRELGEPAHGCE